MIVGFKSETFVPHICARALFYKHKDAFENDDLELGCIGKHQNKDNYLSCHN